MFTVFPSRAGWTRPVPRALVGPYWVVTGFWPRFNLGPVHRLSTVVNKWLFIVFVLRRGWSLISSKFGLSFTQPYLVLPSFTLTFTYFSFFFLFSVISPARSVDFGDPASIKMKTRQNSIQVDASPPSGGPRWLEARSETIALRRFPL